MAVAKNKIRIQVTLEKDIESIVRDLAKKLKVTPSVIINDILKGEIENYENRYNEHI